uniref:Plastid lipid-associated protein/fibrillin conserved domain-containing protein n=1 Tax=Chromera velia CCMP2878 TaxID=1169474 RepID=A0A0G4FAL4_9ALVE|eukprot:Cvel_15908.t1-p1 / transcript=Cvel_15908.t1 / gene=Cvel_15908 / organism=Chromera_velia_CCMP2878 / gene_product=hypothetical protein / transcript_product=hypothetical protein / location=Cvel_scaffold1202:38962-45293(+) / protein_length=775 / sequence_SO=supercontig / SO=protein_coding / is_pseudo=false
MFLTASLLSLSTATLCVAFCPGGQCGFALSRPHSSFLASVSPPSYRRRSRGAFALSAEDRSGAAELLQTEEDVSVKEPAGSRKTREGDGPSQTETGETGREKAGLLETSTEESRVTQKRSAGKQRATDDALLDAFQGIEVKPPEEEERVVVGAEGEWASMYEEEARELLASSLSFDGKGQQAKSSGFEAEDYWGDLDEETDAESVTDRWTRLLTKRVIAKRKGKRIDERDTYWSGVFATLLQKAEQESFVPAVTGGQGEGEGGVRGVSFFQFLELPPVQSLIESKLTDEVELWSLWERAVVSEEDLLAFSVDRGVGGGQRPEKAEEEADSDDDYEWVEVDEDDEDEEAEKEREEEETEEEEDIDDYVPPPCISTLPQFVSVGFLFDDLARALGSASDLVAETEEGKKRGGGKDEESTGGLIKVLVERLEQSKREEEESRYIRWIPFLGGKRRAGLTSEKAKVSAMFDASIKRIQADRTKEGGGEAGVAMLLAAELTEKKMKAEQANQRISKEMILKDIPPKTALNSMLKQVSDSGLVCPPSAEEVLNGLCKDLVRQPDNLIYRGKSKMVEALAGNWTMVFTSSENARFHKAVTGLVKNIPTSRFRNLRLELKSLYDGQLLEMCFHEDLRSVIAEIHGTWDIVLSTSSQNTNAVMQLRLNMKKCKYGFVDTPVKYWSTLAGWRILEFLYVDPELLALSFLSEDSMVVFKKIKEKDQQRPLGAAGEDAKDQLVGFFRELMPETTRGGSSSPSPMQGETGGRELERSLEEQFPPQPQR